MINANALNKKYKTVEGDRLALEELLPVTQRYIATDSPKILEIGCGYGRNLFALSHVPGAQVVGCDISKVELDKAREKMTQYGIANVQTILQTDFGKLPFPDGSFDFVVLWQVLEHILNKTDKARILNEAARVVKNKGHILIETPNQLFPFDYHDNNLPLVHWFLPNRWRYWLTRKIRDEDFPPSQYFTIIGIKRVFKHSPHIKSFIQNTAIYFEERYFDIFKNLGGTRKKFKIIFFVLYFPIYLLLRLLGLPGDLLTPSLRVVFEINK